MGIPGSVGNCDQATREKDRDLRNSMEYLGAGILKKKKNPQKCHFFPKSPILFWKFHKVLESTDFSSFQIKNKQLDKKNQDKTNFQIQDLGEHLAQGEHSQCSLLDQRFLGQTLPRYPWEPKNSQFYLFMENIPVYSSSHFPSSGQVSLGCSKLKQILVFFLNLSLFFWNFLADFSQDGINFLPRSWCGVVWDFSWEECG